MGYNAPLHNGNDMRNGVLALAPQPLGDDCHQPLNIKCHEIGAVLLRYAVTVQNRRDHVLQKLGIAIVQLQGGGVLQTGVEQPLIFLNMGIGFNQLTQGNKAAIAC